VSVCTAIRRYGSAQVLQLANAGEVRRLHCCVSKVSSLGQRRNGRGFAPPHVLPPAPAVLTAASSD
jgi:hypothetical protein